MSFSKSFIFPKFLQLFNCLPTQSPHGQGRRDVELKAHKRGKGEGGQLKTGKMCGHPLQITPYVNDCVCEIGKINANLSIKYC